MYSELASIYVTLYARDYSNTVSILNFITRKFATFFFLHLYMRELGHKRGKIGKVHMSIVKIWLYNSALSFYFLLTFSV